MTPAKTTGCPICGKIVGGSLLEGHRCSKASLAAIDGANRRASLDPESLAMHEPTEGDRIATGSAMLAGDRSVDLR